MIKRIITCLLATFTILCTSVTVFASENTVDKANIPTATLYNVELTSEGIASITNEDGSKVPASTRSSISGYEQTNISGNPAGVFVYPTASGIGGMGATVQSSSSWNGFMSLDILSSDGLTSATGMAVPSNGEWKLNDVYANGITHYSPAYLLFSFKGIPAGQSVSVKIWVYG